MTATMTIEDTFTIKGRGLVLAGHPSAEPAVGMVARLPDGRAWTVRGVERQGMKRWHPGDPSAVLIGDAGDAPPQICDVVELVGESPAASTEPEGPRVVAGVTVYLDGKRLTENVEFSVLGKESAWADMRRQAAIMRDELAEFAFHVKRLGLIDENGEPTS